MSQTASSGTRSVHHAVSDPLSWTQSTTSDGYTGEWGYDCNPEVTIVEAVERHVTVIEYRAKK